MNTKKLGRQSVALTHPPVILARGNAAGHKEGQGPLGAHLDYVDQDDTFGKDSWEKAESAMQRQALERALERAALPAQQLDFFLAGDLLNQCVSSSFAARGLGAPFLGLYGACSTMGEGLCVASMLLDGGFGNYAAVAVSSHFCTAERQYRTPLEYGCQRTPTAQWTVTGAGAVVLGRLGTGVQITHLTLGHVVDKGIKDTNNMGAAMAPAACETLCAHFRDTGRSPKDYDHIVTGDLGKLGSQLLCELMEIEGVPLHNHLDCGTLIYDLPRQDVHCGGSGCGCSATVLTAYLLPQLEQRRWRRILFCPTGALHSPTTAFQGESIPGICHAVALEGEEVRA